MPGFQLVQINFMLVFCCTYMTRIVDPDPDPDWVRIQRLCGSGSVLGIRIQGQEIKKYQWKNALFSYFFCNFTTKKV
jgi:hypothetical protein